MRTLGQQRRICATLLAISSTVPAARGVRRTQLCRQQVTAKKMNNSPS